MKTFGIDPGSDRTGYGCIETDGSRHRIVLCGAIKTPASGTFPEKLLVIHSQLARLLAECRPDVVAIEHKGHMAGPDEGGFESGGINALFEDREGNIWVCTQNGLDRFHDTLRALGFDTLTQPDDYYGAALALGGIGSATKSRSRAI